MNQPLVTGGAGQDLSGRRNMNRQMADFNMVATKPV
jgi:hypothetical protein